MNKLVSTLLNDILDKYEDSVVSKAGSEKNIKIRLTTKHSILTGYAKPDSYNYVDDNDEAVTTIEKLGFVDVSRRDDGSFVSLTLNLEKVNDIYAYLGRKNRDVINGEMVEVFNGYSWSGVFQDFKQSVLSYIKEKYTYPKRYFESIDQLKDICMALDAISNLQSDIKERDFSILVFGDSKRFLSIKSRISTILKNFSKDEYSDDDDVLSDFKIVKNSTYVFAKGNLVFKLGEQIIDLNKLGYEFCLSDEMIDKIEILDCPFDKVITVENLTTFYQFKEKNSLTVYLAGFHNHTKQSFLRKIYEHTPTAAYFHFGDIDAGGISIFKNLVRKTGIPFKPFLMFYMNAIDKKDYLRQLTENDRKRLESLLRDDNNIEFKQTIQWMLKNNVKLEQEAFDFDF